MISVKPTGGGLCAKLFVDGMYEAVQCQHWLADVTPSVPEVPSSRDGETTW